VASYRGQILFDTTKPEGTPQKLLDVNHLKTLGWSSAIEMHQGISEANSWFCACCMYKQNQ